MKKWQIQRQVYGIFFKKVGKSTSFKDVFVYSIVDRLRGRKSKVTSIGLIWLFQWHIKIYTSNSGSGTYKKKTTKEVVELSSWKMKL